MTRGRYPEKAIDKAKETADKRGEVRHYARAPGCIAHFSIVSPHLLAEVFMKPVRRIRTTIEALLREAAEEIDGLKLYPASPQISRELWLSSPKYFRRYFRVCDTGLIELGPDGKPLPAGLPATGPRLPRAGAAAAVPAQDSHAGVSLATPGSPDSPAPEVPVEISPAVPGSLKSPAPEDPGTESSAVISPATPGSPASPAPAVPVPESSGPASPAPVSSSESPAHPARGTTGRGSAHT